MCTHTCILVYPNVRSNQIAFSFCFFIMTALYVYVHYETMKGLPRMYMYRRTPLITLQTCDPTKKKE